jgi:hypothetical protein
VAADAAGYRWIRGTPFQTSYLFFGFLVIESFLLAALLHYARERWLTRRPLVAEPQLERQP